LPGWTGLFVPAGTPAPIIERLNAEVRKAAVQPDVVERLTVMGGEAPAWTPARFGEFVASERRRWKS
jgi:tripartite-type tricarboxylate transporter receptor subunit TctC